MKRSVLFLGLMGLVSNLAMAEVKPAGTVVPYACAWIEASSKAYANATICLANNDQGSEYLTIDRGDETPVAYIRLEKRTINAIGANNTIYSGRGVEIGSGGGHYPVENEYVLTSTTPVVFPPVGPRVSLKVNGKIVLKKIELSPVATTQAL